MKVDKASAEDKGMRARVDTEVAVPTSEGYEAARQTEVLATVRKIDLKKRLVTLRGAYRTQTLEIGADVDLKRLKVGDTVHAVFVAAAAIRVAPLISAR
ncbi:hypothetical protein [Burkholderia alba]|uniref:hypothetical protein n=1 Tax=Burkholderia alba TaxID=2683677 RepID=UPI002B0620D2|nr:hypothetical protein [Burkholderia alba]